MDWKHHFRARFSKIFTVHMFDLNSRPGIKFIYFFEIPRNRKKQGSPKSNCWATREDVIDRKTMFWNMIDRGSILLIVRPPPINYNLLHNCFQDKMTGALNSSLFVQPYILAFWRWISFLRCVGVFNIYHPLLNKDPKHYHRAIKNEQR